MEESVSLEDFPFEEPTNIPEGDDAAGGPAMQELSLHMEPKTGAVMLDPVQQGQCLTRCTFFQRQIAPAASHVGLWGLEFADDGFGCLVSGDQIMCLEDILQKSVYKVDSG